MTKNFVPKPSFAGFLALTIAISSLTLAGCGSGAGQSSLPFSGVSGGGGTTVSRGKGTATFTVTWPEATRVVPVAANSIVVTLTRVAPAASVQAVAPQVLKRPAAGQPLTTTVTFANLELGSYTATAIAYPTAPPTGLPTGVPQAGGPQPNQSGSAALPVVVSGNSTTAITLTMFATVKTLQITPAIAGDTFNLRVGTTRQYVATAYDANNFVVLTNGAITWVQGNTSVATVSQTGLVTTTGLGATLIGATYVEPGVTPGTQGTGATATTLVTVVPVGLQSSNTVQVWPKFHGNAQNTGQAGPLTTGDATTGTIAASFQASNSVVFSSPAVGADGTIYVGSYDTYVYALQRTGSSFTVKWKFKTGDIIESSPALGADGTLYVGSYDGKMYALPTNPADPNNVQPLWTYTANGPIHSSPALDAAGNVYFGATTDFRDTTRSDSRFFALDALNGSVKWIFSGASGGIQTAPALNPAENAVYFGAIDGNVYAVNASNGNLLWQQATGGQIYSSSPSLASAGGVLTLFIGSTSGRVYALDAVNGGAVRWTYDAGVPVYTTPAISTDAGGNATGVYVGTFDNVTTAANSRLLRLDPLTGARVWQFPGLNQGNIDLVTSSPAIGKNGAIYFGSYDGFVYAVKPDGSSQYGLTPQGVPNGVQTGDTIDSSPAIGPDGTVYLGSFNGQVLAIK